MRSHDEWNLTADMMLPRSSTVVMCFSVSSHNVVRLEASSADSGTSQKKKIKKADTECEKDKNKHGKAKKDIRQIKKNEHDCQRKAMRTSVRMNVYRLWSCRDAHLFVNIDFQSIY